MTHVVTRFAPSPTGHLHIGGARTALFCWLLARHYGGKFYLRIEDTDRERSRQEYTDSILASMRWLGLDWDEPLVYQSTRTDVYNQAVDQLLANGHAYWCSCTPEEVEAMRTEARARGEKPRYNGCCRERGLGPGPGRVVRLKAPQSGRIVFDDMIKGTISVDVSELDDMVLRRTDGMPTYNLAVVVDDAAMGITHVVRGDDHVPNTPKQILIYQALGLPLPKFGHVPMILGPDRKKLSKRHGARAVIEYEQDGLLPQALVNCLVRLGWSHGDQELFTLQELVELFDGTNMNSSAAAFDPDHLQWLNAHYLRSMPTQDLAQLVQPFVRKEGICAEESTTERIMTMIPLYRERSTSLIELARGLALLLCPSGDLPYDPASVTKNLTEEGRAHVRALRSLLAEQKTFSAEDVEQLVHGYVEEQGIKMKQVGPAMRVSLIGTNRGPGLGEIMAALGREETLARLDRAVTL